jgi:glycosyltransferase involved in cell wall biosynthesis
MTVRVGVFHPGSQHAYETALAFQEAGCLSWFATSIFFDQARWPYSALRFVPAAARKRLELELKRRYHPDLQPSLVRTLGVWEWLERLSMRAGLRTVEHYANEWGNVRFGQQVAHLDERTPVDVVWGYDTSSLSAFRRVKSRGTLCVLEQTVGHPRVWNRLLTEERRVEDADFDPYPRPYPESDMRKVESELALADRIVCASPFVRDTMVETGTDPGKIAVIPYGVATDRFTPGTRDQSHDGLKLLFAGHFGLRKGAWYLLEALRRLTHLKHLSMTVFGKQTVPERFLAPFGDRIQCVPHVPRNQMHHAYQQGDVFVLPTLFEGSAISVFEALASGLPVVTTPNAGSVVRDGMDGFVVPIRDARALADRIEQLYGDTALRREMGIRARERALEFPWQRYRGELVRWLDTWTQ